MWKIVVGFILFAALALFILSRGGDIDMGGEKHGVLKPDAAVFFNMSLGAWAAEGVQSENWPQRG